MLDLADRKVVGWALNETIEAEVPSEAAWRMAVRNRPVTQSLLFHSDRGVQYVCQQFRKQLIGGPVRQSMSRKDDPYDTDFAESFWSRFKAEVLEGGAFLNIEKARTEILNYVQIYYNRMRRHSSLGYQSPLTFESQYYAKPANKL